MDDLPVAWRNEKKIVPAEKCTEMSVLAAFTWMPRRVTLIPDAEEGYVREAYIQPGLNFLGNGLWVDPHVAYRKNKKEEWYSVKPQSGRELWRDIGMIAAAYQENASHRPPLAVTHYEAITGKREGLVRLNMTGLVTNQAQYVSLQSDTLSLPPVILEIPEKGEFLCMEMVMIENIARCVETSYGELEASAVQQLLAFYFSGIRNALFSEFLPLLGESDSEQEDWQLPLISLLENMILNTLRKVSDEAAGMFGAGAKNLVKLTEATDMCMRKSLSILRKSKGEEVHAD